MDPCIFRRIDNSMVHLQVMYIIDDILIVALKEEIARFESESIEEFWWVALDVSKSHFYLGMQLNLRKEVSKSM